MRLCQIWHVDMNELLEFKLPSLFCNHALEYCAAGSREAVDIGHHRKAIQLSKEVGQHRLVGCASRRLTCQKQQSFEVAADFWRNWSRHLSSLAIWVRIGQSAAV
jgi:hypothetical protein